MEKFIEIVKTHTTSKNIKINLNAKKHWISQNLKIELKKRKELFELKKKYPHNQKIKNEYSRQKKRVKFRILESRKEYYDKKFSNTIDNPKLFWNNINSLIYNKLSTNFTSERCF